MRRYLSLLLFIGLAWGQLDTLWTKSFEGLGFANALESCNDGGYIISGSNSIVKTNIDGEIEWQSQNWNNYDAKRIKELDNGDFIIGGYFNGNFIMNQLSNNGDFIWVNTYEDILEGFELYNILVTSDSGFFITGYTTDSPYPLGTLLKIDEDGEIEWQITDEGYYYFYSAFENDEGFFVFGEKFGESWYTDISITQIDFQGNIVNDEIYDFYDNDWPHSSIQLDNGGYVTLFSSFGSSTGSIIGMMKIFEGEVEWVYELEYSSNRISETTDGGFILFKNDEGIIKTNSQGEFEWEFIYDFPDNPAYLFENMNGQYIVLTNYGVLLAIGIASPMIEEIDDQEIEEDTDPFLFVTGTFYGSIDDYTLYAYSDTADFYVIDEPAVFGNGWRFELIPTQNWFGEATVTLILAENESGLADTTDFMVTVIPINDSPEPFTLIYPTSSDTLEISTDTDDAYGFYWEASDDVDSEVSYITTITLDYFGDVYTETYESSDSSVSVSGYEWSALMTNLNLQRWTLEYFVAVSDEEFTIESEVGEFVFENTSLSIDESITPLEFNLHQNYPNPFNPITTLRYDLPEDGLVDITVYDMLGNVVSNLVNANQSSGYKSIQWDATNNQGEPVSAGVYLYKIQAGDFVDTKKMILLK
tara:strand:+ start:667 stop:2598 length:1932 start_codon:yes stop_codon:yes gene_type:complete